MFRDLLLRYRQTLLLTMALALPIASMYYHGKERKETSYIERGLLVLTAPATRMMTSAIERGRGLLRGYLLLTDVQANNEELLRNNQLLLGEALKSRALAEELKRIKLLCEFRAERADFTTIPARVVGRDVSQFFQVIRIKLAIHGATAVREGQAVITNDGVVGRVEKLSQDYADVMLVTDARSQVHATIPGKGVIGSVKGKGKKNEFGVQFIYLDRVDRTVPVTMGDAVLTTGHDRIFPAGLEIGHVAEDRGVQNGPYHEYVLSPAVAYATLEEVLIVVGYRGPDTDGSPAAAPALKVKRATDPANTPDAPP